MIDKRIGKIEKIFFGEGGYQDACIGVTFDLGSEKESWGVGDFWGAWAIARSEYSKWTEEDRIKSLGEMVMRVNKLMQDAKVHRLDDLKGKPIEVTFEGNMLKEWRILTEAI